MDVRHFLLHLGLLDVLFLNLEQLRLLILREPVDLSHNGFDSAAGNDDAEKS